MHAWAQKVKEAVRKAAVICSISGAKKVAEIPSTKVNAAQSSASSGAPRRMMEMS